MVQKISNSTITNPALSERLLTDERIAAMLKEKMYSLDMTRIEFHVEVQKQTRMEISYSHLASMIKGKRPPNDVVLKYLGIEEVRRVVR